MHLDQAISTTESGGGTRDLFKSGQVHEAIRYFIVASRHHQKAKTRAKLREDRMGRR